MIAAALSTYDDPSARAERKRLAGVRLAQVRADLAMVDVIPQAALIERWRLAGVREADLRAARREAARQHHPDRAPTATAAARANRHLGCINAVIDLALTEIKEKEPANV